MKLYAYDKSTKELIGMMDAHIDPLASMAAQKEIYSIPPFTTPLPPLEGTKGKVNVFNDKKGYWELVEDNRGTVVYDKKGNASVIAVLGPVPEGYATTKKLNLQEEQTLLINELNVAFEKAQSTEVKIKNIVGNIDIRVKLEQLKVFIGEQEFGVLNLSDGTSKIVSKKEIEYASKYFYLRSLFLAIRKNELMKDIKSAKNKSQLEKIKINFNIEKEINGLIKKTDDEISNYIRRKLK